MKVIIVCGPVGVGKSTYTNSLAKEINAVKFSIDPWMQTLFSKDMTSLDYSWMIERVERCSQQIWEVGQQIVKLNGVIILDLGFTTKAQRKVFIDLAKSIGAPHEVHYLHASTGIRKERVKKRNVEKDPTVYSFEVTDFMFDFMEPRFEIPDEEEMLNGKTIDAEAITH